MIDILAFGVHPDDVELSASGTLLRHIDAGKSVGIIDLTEGELGTRGTVETRYEEAKKASEILGIAVRENLQMADGFFEINQVNLLKVIEKIRQYRPTVVLANAINDRHPDHGRAGKLVADACFLAGLRKIETTCDGKPQDAFRPRAVYHYIQDYHLQPDLIVDVTPFVDKKFESILAYSTQFFNPNSDEPETPISGKEFLEFIRGRMLQNGRIIGVTYAEGFTVARPVGVEDLTNLW
jgi:bacillithiol biosynthesis deacetylase BshB1